MTATVITISAMHDDMMLQDMVEYHMDPACRRILFERLGDNVFLYADGLNMIGKPFGDWDTRQMFS